MSNDRVEVEKECLWESGQLGNSKGDAVVVAAGEEKAIDEALELQMISIRLPKAMIEDLKMLAAREKLGYQPLIRRVMKLYIEGEFKAIAYDMQFQIAKAQEQAHAQMRAHVSAQAAAKPVAAEKAPVEQAARRKHA